MWAHYGQNHKGVCLVFDEKILNNLFQEQYINDLKIPDSIHYELIKTSEIPKLNDIDKIYKYLEENNKEFFLKKDKDWKPESEYRFVVIKKEQDDGPSYLENIDQALIAIILGIDFNENYKCSIEQLRSNLPNKNIGVYQLCFENGEFKLDTGNEYNYFDCMIVEN
ncbi:MAG TPA: DUF2971 domain-containing protein [Prolixibacteraceae bacterium]|nr:DUF2971 domain-containing protein [Prolixibacteraceae bacterium]